MNLLINLLNKTRLLRETLTTTSFAFRHVIPLRGNGRVIIVRQARSVLLHVGQPPEY
jgi:hypothetical protein